MSRPAPDTAMAARAPVDACGKAASTHAATSAHIRWPTITFQARPSGISGVKNTMTTLAQKAGTSAGRLTPPRVTSSIKVSATMKTATPAAPRITRWDCSETRAKLTGEDLAGEPSQVEDFRNATETTTKSDGS